MLLVLFARILELTQNEILQWPRDPTFPLLTDSLVDALEQMPAHTAHPPIMVDLIQQETVMGQKDESFGLGIKYHLNVFFGY